MAGQVPQIGIEIAAMQQDEGRVPLRLAFTGNRLHRGGLVTRHGPSSPSTCWGVFPDTAIHAME